jgi:hypothetical protein
MGILPSAHSKETSLSPGTDPPEADWSWLRSVSYAVSIGTGNPSRPPESH